MLRKIILTLAAVVVAIVAVKAEKPSFDQLAVKAERFITFKEWASAQAMLQLMIAERPTDASLTGKAIAIAGVRGDSIEQLRLFREAVKARQPFEKVFTAVEKETFSLARGDVYEDFLLMLAREEPWVRRSVDSYLLRYYSYRSDAQGMIEYADRMLAGLPDDITFLSDKARGLMLQGQYTRAMEVYARITEIDPGNVDALLALAFYARSCGDTTLALAYFTRAHAIMPTPYIESCLKALRDKTLGF